MTSERSFLGFRRLQARHRLPISRGRRLAHDPCGVSADDVGVCREERSERLHGEVVAEAYQRAARHPGVGTEEPKVGVGFMWRLPGAGRGHPASTTGDRRSPNLDLPGARPDDCPRRARRLAFQIGMLQLQLAVLRLPDRLALPQHHVACWAKGLAVGPGMGGRCIPNGQPPRPLTVQFTSPTPPLFSPIRSAPRSPRPHPPPTTPPADAIRQDKPHNEAGRATEPISRPSSGGRPSTGGLRHGRGGEELEVPVRGSRPHDLRRSPPIHANVDGTYSALQPGITKEI